MNRLFWLLVALALVVAACGGTDTEGDPETSGASGGGSTADVAITEVVFGDHVTITNLGDASVDVSGLWLCNRPAYTELSGELAAGASMTVDAALLGDVPADGGEAALYTSNSFGDASQMLDYVGWGSGGGRTSVADEAGLWPPGDSVQATGGSISSPGGGSSAADWS